MFAIYDSKAKAYMQPFFAASEGLAARMVAEACRDRSSAVFRYGEDMTLFKIGTFDDSNGVVEAVQRQVNLGVLSNYREEVNRATDA